MTSPDIKSEADRLLEELFNTASSYEEFVKFAEEAVRVIENSIANGGWDKLDYSNHGK